MGKSFVSSQFYLKMTTGRKKKKKRKKIKRMRMRKRKRKRKRMRKRKRKKEVPNETVEGVERKGEIIQEERRSWSGRKRKIKK